MNKVLENEWTNPETAKKYDKYTQRPASIYRKTSRDLIKIAEIEKGMKIVDLACGTGITTKEILKRIKGTGKIYAIDASQEMLNKARERIKDANVFFIHSLAEEMDRIVKEKVDRVVCNSAFWQMTNINKALNAINIILKNDGKFIFNLSQQFFIFPQKPEADRVQLSFRRRILEIAVNKYGFFPKDSNKKSLKRKALIFDIVKVKKILENNCFAIDSYKIINHERTLEDVYEFNKIPIMANNLLPGLNYEKQVEIIDAAAKEFDMQIKCSNRWIYFAAKKFNLK